MNRDRSWVSIRLISLTLLVLATFAASAQPFDAWLQNASGHSYIQLPNNSALNFAGQSFTFEAWVSVTDVTGCGSIAGNDYVASMWIGVCGTKLRSYVRGAGSSVDGGTIPAADWTHIAVTFDAATKRRTHYVDGEEALTQIDPGPLVPSSAAWRLYSDVSWQYTPNGGIDEVRFWNVARTRDQIRSTITSRITSATPGLVARYALDGNPTDSIGTAHGSRVGTSSSYLTGAVSGGCSTDATTLCVGPSGRFAVKAFYRAAGGGAVGSAAVVPYTTSESGMFTFFSPTNWEAVVKVLNACGVNNRWWVFAGGLTDQHTELEVTDRANGITKRYFNYSGVPFQPLNDTTAFATCP